jgi:hypothetical protein
LAQLNYMNFQELNEYIPYATGEVEHVLTMKPYKNITLMLPGRHQHDTVPPGGDFVVKITDSNKKWKGHQFKHTDLFEDFEEKRNVVQLMTRELLKDYESVVNGVDPDILGWSEHDLPGIQPKTLLYACQCLAVAEHRRYGKFESKGGGRFLPLRFSTGIALGLWSAKQAADKQRQGRPGVEELEAAAVGVKVMPDIGGLGSSYVG